MEFKIESSVPLPVRKRANARYPWVDLKVGDSFFVADRRPGDMGPPMSLKMKGWKFTMRTEQNGKQTGVRVWRIA